MKECVTKLLAAKNYTEASKILETEKYGPGPKKLLELAYGTKKKKF